MATLFFLSGISVLSPTKRRAIIALISLPMPMLANKSSKLSYLVSSTTLSSSAWSISSSFMVPNAWRRRRFPIFVASLACWRFKKCRMFVRARALTTKFSQLAFGLALGDVITSILWPFSRGELNG